MQVGIFTNKPTNVSGANVVRFNNPSPGTKSDFHRICIDPKGVSNKANLHQPVSAGVVKTAESVQKVLKVRIKINWTSIFFQNKNLYFQVSGKVLLVVSIVATGFRICKTIYDEVDIDSEIDALENIVNCLKEDLSNNKGNRADTEEALEFAKNLLEDARDSKRNPGKKTILACLCIGGEFGGATALAYAGAQGGAAIGSFGGPVGAIGGAVTGGVIGAIAGTELGASAVENFRCDKDGIATEVQGSLVGFGDKVQGQVLGLDGNVYAGKGVEVGARAALFQMQEKGEGSFSLGKVGANFGATDRGVDVSVEGKVAWTEIESEKAKIGVGLNVDTGFKATEDGVDMSVLGFGFSAGKDGVCLKLPFLNLTWK